MAENLPPARVLSDAVLEAMAGDRLLAAAFVTFELSPQFFEDSILAPLAGLDGRGSPTVRRLLLEERLREMDEVVVLYDATGLRPDGPLRQRVRAIPVSTPAGVVHAKHALLLVGTAEKPTLVLLTTSANLTESGWWRNVEVADLERIEAGAASPLRDDLLDLIGAFRDLAGADPPLGALARIEAFLRDKVRPAPGLPRLWLGREPLDAFLAAHVPTPTGVVELVAPFVDEAAAPIASLAKTLAPRELVVWFPRDRDEAGAAGEAWRDGVRAIPGARFGELGIDRTFGKGSDARRFVHAKVIRATDPSGKRAFTLAGSPNLSVRGHAGWQTGSWAANLETAVLREGIGGRWLTPLRDGEEPPLAKAPVSAGDEPAPLVVRVRFDWETRRAHARLVAGPAGEVAIGAMAGGVPGFRVDFVADAHWMDLPEPAAAWLERELVSTNVFAAWRDGLPPSPVLVEEDGLAYRPSMVAAQLRASDILEHWSLLSEAQRANHLDATLPLAAGDDPEAPEASSVTSPAGETMFDGVAGIVHAFLMLRRRINTALDKGQTAAVEAWVYGARHDSLGTLLDRVLSEEQEPVRRVLFALSAAEVLQAVEACDPSLGARHAPGAAAVRERITCLEQGWDTIQGASRPGEDPRAFRDWLERWWRADA